MESVGIFYGGYDWMVKRDNWMGEGVENGVLKKEREYKFDFVFPYFVMKKCIYCLFFAWLFAADVEDVEAC